MRDREFAHAALAKAKAGHYLDFRDARDIEKYLVDLELQVASRERQVSESVEYQRASDRAIELLQERVATLEKERLGESALTQRMHKAEVESRAARDALTAVQYDRDRLLELVEWWDALATEGYSHRNKSSRTELNNERVRYLTGRKPA